MYFVLLPMLLRFLCERNKGCKFNNSQSEFTVKIHTSYSQEFQNPFRRGSLFTQLMYQLWHGYYDLVMAKRIISLLSHEALTSPTLFNHTDKVSADKFPL